MTNCINLNEKQHTADTMQREISRYDEIINAGFRAIVDNTDAMVFVKDINLVYVTASMPFAQMVGKSSVEEIVGHTDFEIFENAELAKRYTTDDHKLLESNQNLVNYVEPLTDEHGHPRYSNTSKYILRGTDGQPIGILGISNDITREYLARQRHQQELKYLFELPADTYAALFMDIDDWRVIRHQRRTTGAYIIQACETMEVFIANALECIPNDDTINVRNFYRDLSKETMLQLYNDGKRHHSLEYPRRMPNGEILWVRVDIHFLIDPETSHQCAIWLLRDINSRKQEAIDLLHAAEHDALTGLLNRAYTTKYIQQTIESTPQACHALFIIDVDNFKLLNDTMGHQTGDQFLIDLSNMLKNSFRETDIVGRLGGDEFFIFMKNVSNNLVVTEKAETIRKLCKTISENYMEQLSISVGISLYPLHGVTLEELYKQADNALYKAKEKKNQFVFAVGK